MLRLFRYSAHLVAQIAARAWFLSANGPALHSVCPNRTSSQNLETVLLNNYVPITHSVPDTHCSQNWVWSKKQLKDPVSLEMTVEGGWEHKLTHGHVAVSGAVQGCGENEVG